MIFLVLRYIQDNLYSLPPLRGHFDIRIDDLSNCFAVNFLKIFVNSLNFTQHVLGPTHNWGHTLDLVFTYCLNIGSLNLVDFHVSDQKCIVYDTIFRAVTKNQARTVRSHSQSEHCLWILLHVLNYGWLRPYFLCGPRRQGHLPGLARTSTLSKENVGGWNVGGGALGSGVITNRRKT